MDTYDGLRTMPSASGLEACTQPEQLSMCRGLHHGPRIVGVNRDYAQNPLNERNGLVSTVSGFVKLRSDWTRSTTTDSRPTPVQRIRSGASGGPRRCAWQRNLPTRQHSSRTGIRLPMEPSLTKWDLRLFPFGIFADPAFFRSSTTARRHWREICSFGQRVKQTEGLDNELPHE